MEKFWKKIHTNIFLESLKNKVLKNIIEKKNDYEFLAALNVFEESLYS